MPSNGYRLPTDWLATDDPSCDPWILRGSEPDSVGWRDACIGNGLIGQRVTPSGDGRGYGGIMQLVLAGFAGIRVNDDGLSITPQLPSALPWMTIHGVYDMGKQRSITVHGDGRVEDIG